MKIWSTVFCLTEGITCHDAEEPSDSQPDMVKVPRNSSESYDYDYYLVGEGVDWHKSLEAAVARAEELRAKKLRLLDAQIKRISAIKF